MSSSVFDEEQKKQIATRLTDAFVAIEGEAMRSVTWVVVKEVTHVEAQLHCGFARTLWR